MSLLLDALRKGRAAGRPPGAESAHADSVLATLGYGPRPRAGPAPARAVAAAAVLIVLAIAAWGLSSIPFPSNRVTGNEPVEARAIRPAHATPAPMDPGGSVAAPVVERAAEPVLKTSREPSGEPSRGRSRKPLWSSDFRLAVYYHRAGDFERALAHYRAVLKRNELNPEAHNNLGLLYQQKGLLDESAREFQRATLINPRYARAHSNFGVTLMGQGKLDLATAEFELACSLDPRDVDARINLALAQKANRQAEAAKATLLNALAMDGSSAAAHYNLALLYDESGDTSRALEHYREFLDRAGVEHVSLARDVRARIEALMAKRQ